MGVCVSPLRFKCGRFDLPWPVRFYGKFKVLDICQRRYGECTESPGAPF